jgi:hypothetical protein
MDPTSSADVKKSSPATSTVIATIITIGGPRFICHRHCNGHPVTAASECSFALPHPFRPEPLSRSQPEESILGVPHPLVAFTPCKRATTGDLASAEHGKNGGREGELHLTIYRHFVFI